MKQVITARMYEMLSDYADTSRHIVHQKRYYFLYEQQSFHIYEYISPDKFWTIQCQSQLRSPIIPSFLKVKNIERNDQSFSSYFISRKDISRASSFDESSK